MYETFYSPMSEVAHVGNVLSRYVTDAKEIQPIRYPLGFAKVFETSFLLFMTGLVHFARFYQPVLANKIERYAAEHLKPRHDEIDKLIENGLGKFK